MLNFTLCQKENESDKYHQNLLEQKNIAAIISLASISENSTILDVECGAKIALSELLLKKPAKLVGIDASNMAGKETKNYIRDNRVQLTHTNLFDVEDTFDIVFIYNSYLQFTDKVAFAKKTASLLSKYGRFIIAFNKSREHSNFINKKSLNHTTTELYSVYREAIIFKDWFHIDIMVDTSELYILSGVKKFTSC